MNTSKQYYYSLEHKEMKRKDVFQYMLELDGIEHRKYLSWNDHMTKHKICGALAALSMNF